jgi:hypothetical protein
MINEAGYTAAVTGGVADSQAHAAGGSVRSWADRSVDPDGWRGNWSAK